MAGRGEGYPWARGSPGRGLDPQPCPCSRQRWAQPALGSAAGESCQGSSLEGVAGKARGEAAPVSRKLAEIPFSEGCAACWVAVVCTRSSVRGSGQRHPTLAKEGQAFLCFLAGLEPAPAWPLCPAVGFLQHPSVNGYIDTYIYMQIDLLPSPGLVFVHGNRNCCKIRVSGEGACWVCENPLTDRCCMHLHGLLLWQQEQVQSQLYGMQICLAAPRANPCSHTGG